MSTEPHTRNASYWSGQLVAVARRRDRECFMRIYDHFAPRVRLYLKGLGSPEAVAEELAQEALLRLWQRAESYDPGRSQMSTWLFCIARNLHIDRVRRESHWVPMQEELDRLEGLDDAGPSNGESHVEHAELRARVEQLPAIQAQLVRMSFYEAKSHQEIAGELHIPLGTVKSHIRRALLRLQGSLRGSR